MTANHPMKEPSNVPARPEPLTLVFDTSILVGIKLDRPSPEFRLLLRLRNSGKVKLMVPEMAAREWLNRRSGPASQALDLLHSALCDLQRHASLAELPAIETIAASELLRPETIVVLQQDSEDWHRMQLNHLRLSMIKLELEDHTRVLDGYFDGEPPFSGKKARKDIPDALVLAGAMRAFAEDNRAIFVCNDDRLRNAAKGRGMTVASSLPELLKQETIASLHSNPAFALWWEQKLKSIVRMVQEFELESLIEIDLVNAVAGVTVTHPDIPDDNQEAFVQSAGDFTDIKFDWDKAESLGEGVLSVPMTFDASIDLDFYVYRGDAFDVPDWVSVSLGDFEDDHYFEASASMRGRYSARFVLEVDEAVMNENFDLAETEISIEDAELDDFTN